VRFEAIDEQSRSAGKGEATFQVEGRDVPPASALTIRGLAFYREAEDDVPLGVAAFRAGEAVWVKFDITGYKFGEQNSIDITYDVAVNAADGREMFSQPDAATEKSQSYYPQPWVPAVFSLALKSDTPLGTYTLTVTARDGVGNQTAAGKGEFKVE
jgi:hypothetical protein